MSKKKIKITTITPEQLFNMQKPRYNGYGCGYGAHGDKKYNRAKQKRIWRKTLF